MALSFFLQRHGYPSKAVFVANATTSLAGCFIAYTSFYLFCLFSYIIPYRVKRYFQDFILFSKIFLYFQALPAHYNRNGACGTNSIYIMYNAAFNDWLVAGYHPGVRQIRIWHYK
jgi:hypothetical protein